MLLLLQCFEKDRCEIHGLKQVSVFDFNSLRDWETETGNFARVELETSRQVFAGK